MRAWQIEGSFGTDHLRLVERPDPEPGWGELVVGVKSVSLNFRDLMVIRGDYNPRMPLPRIPCSDGAGEVLAVGEGVAGFAVGDRVTGCFMPGWVDGRLTAAAAQSALGGVVDGMLAEQVRLPADGVVRTPSFLSDAEAACLPCAGVTAWHALAELGLKAGDTVLTLGTGGVSVFAIQIARLCGARVIATSSSDEKLDRARRLGAHETINYKTTSEWDEEVRRLTNGDGVDYVVEVGGAGTLGRSLQAARHGGIVVLIGVLAGGRGEVPLVYALMKGLRVQGIYVGSKAMLERMTRALVTAECRPVIDQRFGFDDAPRAISALQTAEHFGKIVIEFG